MQNGGDNSCSRARKFVSAPGRKRRLICGVPLHALPLDLNPPQRFSAEGREFALPTLQASQRERWASVSFATDAFGRRSLSCASRRFTGRILKGSKGSGAEA